VLAESNVLLAHSDVLLFLIELNRTTKYNILIVVLQKLPQV